MSLADTLVMNGFAIEFQLFIHSILSYVL